MKNFNIIRGHWKIWYIRGIAEKGGLGQLRGGLGKRGGGYFWRGWYCNVHDDPQEVFYKMVFGKSSDWVLLWPLDQQEYPKNVENVKEFKSLYLLKFI